MNEDTQLIENPLIEVDKFLKAGAHIGTKMKTGEMRRFIYKERKDGLKVLDIQTLNDRIKAIAGFLCRFESPQIVIVSHKLYGQKPAKEFGKAIGAKVLVGRFVPGTFTNPQSKEFIEPKVIISTESDSDMQAITEASSVHAVVISLVSTNNLLKNIDIAVPVNNKGRKSLALVFWLLAREMLKAKGLVKTDAEFTPTIDDFEYKLKESEKEELREKFARDKFSKRPPRRDNNNRRKPSRR